MTSWRAIGLLLLAGVAPLRAAPTPRFPMAFGVRLPGEVFGVPPASMVVTRRLYPGESVEAVVTASLHDADATGLENDLLVSELRACVRSPDDDEELGRNVAITCEQVPGVAWTITPRASFHDLSADLRFVAFDVPPGTWTLVVVLDDPELRGRLGARAPAQLRSNYVHVTSGPPRDFDEELSRRVNACRRAQERGDWRAQRSCARAILRRYPQSVFALCLLGDAEESRGMTLPAIAAYERASRVLEAGQDVRAPALLDPRTREGKRREIRFALADLRGERLP